MAEMAARGATVEALESLYRADLPRFVRAAAAIVGDEAVGRDAVQEAFVQAVRRRSIATALDVEVGTVSATLATAHSALRRSYDESVR